MRLYKAIKYALVALFLVLICDENAFSFSWSQTELHHIFPQAYAGWFRERGIEPNLWCIPLSREQHTGAGKGIHHKKYMISNGQNFNGSWKFFIDRNPNASRDQCFAFATMLLAEFGINLHKQKFFDYVSKKASGSKIPKGKLIEKSSKFAFKYLKWGSRLVRISPFIIVAWELYDLGSEFDISIDEDQFDKGIDAYIEGENLYYEGKANDARAKFLIANYLFGSIFHKEIMKQTSNLYSEIVNKFNTERQKQALELCLYFLNNAYKIKSESKILFPQVPLYIGEILAITGKKREAVSYLQEAETEFVQMGKPELAEKVKELIAVL